MANEFEKWLPTRLAAFFGVGGAGEIGKWATRWGQAVGFTFDSLADGMRQGVKAGFVALAPTDAVPFHADMRLIEQIPDETIEALRLRLLDAWDHWGLSGNAFDLAEKLKAYLKVGDGAGNLAVYSPAFDGWATDDIATAGASRLWVVIGDDGSSNHCPWTQPVIGSGVAVGSGGLVGITMTEEELHRARRIFKKYRPTHMVGAELIVAFDAEPVDILADVDATANKVRIALQAPMIGYGSSSGTIGPATSVGVPFT